MNIKKRGGYSLLAASIKSQAAIFLIMSLLIILSGVLYFFYQRQLVDKEIEIVQPEILPIKSYVEHCIKTAAEDGLAAIGLSGGYIQVPDGISNDPRTYLSQFASGFKIPYWWHDGIESIPSEEFINRQLTGHIASGLKGCINNFEAFANKFEVNALSEPQVNVQFNENGVYIGLEYPLEIIAKDGNFKALHEKYVYTVPIRFKKVFELAKLIMERENKDYFLEKKTIDLISMDREIPVTDMQATCQTKTWQLSNIREKLKTLLRVNLPYVKIKGTDYDANIYVPNPRGKSTYAETYFQQHYVWDIDKDADKKFKNMKISFAYENWPIKVYARPSENGILKSNSQKGTDMLSFFCLHIWHFTYDVNYPVFATVFDKETETNKPYQFSFAFKVNVDHNQPARQNTGTALFEAAADLSSDEYCNDIRNEITIFTVDNATGEDIRDVNLTFVCGRFYCSMGKSNWLSLGAAAGLTARFPYCVNGVIKGAKEGYSEAKSFIQTDVDARSYVLTLNPIKEFAKYKVVKHSLANPGISEELGQNQKASILIKGKSIGYESFAVYPKEADFPLNVPYGKDAAFEVTIYLVDDENIVGGYIGEWKAGKSALKESDEIVFHVIEQEHASDDERFLFISGLSSYSKRVPAPELK
ncbi:hypothetical protein HYY70_06945 [Candidatus Woesearchaeota archaeon]|nr:hypothetical protein [Candidatus Woesearchaeota archaeon]